MFAGLRPISPSRSIFLLFLPASIFIALWLFLPTPAAAQCAGVCQGNEVLVGEDDKNCYCKDRVEYAACIRKVGVEFEQKRNRLCSLAIGRCFNEKKAEFKTAAGICLATCINPLDSQRPLTIATCARNCGVAEIIVAYRIADQCLFDGANSCQTAALAEQRQATEKCKE